jgi:Uma2 family endonuclease
MVAAQTRLRRYTLADLDAFPDDGKLRELVDGQIVEWDMPTWYHGFILNAIAHLLTSYVLDHDLGAVVGGDPLVSIEGSVYHARGPDVAFYDIQRIPSDFRQPTTTTAPDFVIEVISPSDRATEVERKIADWLRADVRLLWYVNPDAGMTTVYYRKTIQRVAASEVLDGVDVVPGFTLRLTDLFDRLTRLLPQV